MKDRRDHIHLSAREEGEEEGKDPIQLVAVPHLRESLFELKHQQVEGEQVRQAELQVECHLGLLVQPAEL